MDKSKISLDDKKKFIKLLFDSIPTTKTEEPKVNSCTDCSLLSPMQPCEACPNRIERR